MSQLDALLARSQQPGQYVERKSFSLARNKAVEKMREFTLRHPEQYILELVQAAVFANATWLAIDLTPNSVLVGFIGGKRITKEELDQLFDYLFVDQTHRPTRHLMQLAVGVNALLQRSPSVIRVESGDGKANGTARLDLSKSGKGTVGTVQAPLAGTYIYAEFNTGWLGRFVSKTNVREEIDLVERRCIYTPTPILLNGTAPFGYTGRRHVQLFGMTSQTPIEDNERRGSIGRVKSNSVKPEFRLVVGGVWITSQTIPQLGNGLAGVICDDKLRKTADMSDIVQEDRYLEMLHELQPVATQLIRRSDKKYTPPALPPRPKKNKADAPTSRAPTPVLKAEELPARLKQMGSRPELLVAHLPKHGSDSLVFWVTKEDAPKLEQAANALAFPHRVLILTPGQALTLEYSETYQTARRLTSPEDVAFVRRALERRTRVHEVPVPIDALPSSLKSCVLRHHLEGPLPHWGVDAKGVPAHIQIGEGAEYLVCLPLQLSNVSAQLVWLGDAPEEAEMDALATDTVMREAWRLMQRGAEAKSRELAAALISLNATPFYSDHSGGFSLDVGFPTRWWADQVDQITAMPLADVGDEPLTLGRFASLQGTNQVLDVDEATLNEFAQLEERLGWGHLAHASLFGQIIVGWVFTGKTWRRVNSLVGVGGFQAFIGLQPTLRPVVFEDEGTSGMKPAGGDTPWDLPGLTCLESVDQPILNADWDRGLSVVLKVLAEMEAAPVDSDQRLGWGQFERSFATEERVRGMGGLALIGLALHLEAWSLPIIHGTSGKMVSLEDIRAGGVKVAPLHGAFINDEAVAVLSFDELCLLERAGIRPALFFDDSPDVWRELKASSDTWLLSQTLRIPGLTGRIGFRYPYDGTPGMLVESTRAFHALPHQAISVPCHGIIEMSGGLVAPNETQGKLLALAAMELIQALLERLMDEPNPERRHALERYGRDFVENHWAENGGRLSSRVAKQLAEIIEVSDSSGQPNRLSQHLKQRSDATPPVGGQTSQPEGGAAYRNPDRVLKAMLGQMNTRLGRDMRWTLKIVELPNEVPWYWKPIHAVLPQQSQASLFWIRSEGLGTVIHVRVNAEHPLFVSATNSPSAMKLLGLEMVRRCADFLARQGFTVDVPGLMKMALMDQLLDGQG